jgi:hypothetical protein
MMSFHDVPEMLKSAWERINTGRGRKLVAQDLEVHTAGVNSSSGRVLHEQMMLMQQTACLKEPILAETET